MPTLETYQMANKSHHRTSKFSKRMLTISPILQTKQIPQIKREQPIKTLHNILLQIPLHLLRIRRHPIHDNLLPHTLSTSHPE